MLFPQHWEDNHQPLNQTKESVMTDLLMNQPTVVTVSLGDSLPPHVQEEIERITREDLDVPIHIIVHAM